MAWGIRQWAWDILLYGWVDPQDRTTQKSRKHETISRWTDREVSDGWIFCSSMWRRVTLFARVSHLLDREKYTRPHHEKMYRRDCSRRIPRSMCHPREVSRTQRSSSDTERVGTHGDTLYREDMTSDAEPSWRSWRWVRLRLSYVFGTRRISVTPEIYHRCGDHRYSCL